MGVLWVVLGCVWLYSRRLLLDVSLNPDGLWLYRLSPLAPPIFAVGHLFHLAALGCLWVYRRGHAGALLPGGVVLFADKVVNVALLPFVPGIDGLEATRLIRAWERTTAARIPIVAMTASAMKGDRERCLEAGMDGYLAKPIDADELFETVERFAAPVLGDSVRPRERERLPDATDVATIVDRLDGDTAAARAMGRLFLMEYPRYLRDLSLELLEAELQRLLPLVRQLAAL